MYLRGVTREEIGAALDAANERYAGNLRLRQCEEVGSAWRVSLGVIKTGAAAEEPIAGRWLRYVPRAFGVARGETGKATGRACFHATGAFLDALPVRYGVSVRAGGQRYNWLGMGARDWYISRPESQAGRVSTRCECVIIRRGVKYGEAFALFPGLSDDPRGDLVTVYDLTGGHGQGDLLHLMAREQSVPCGPDDSEEVAGLLKNLRDVCGYAAVEITARQAGMDW
jgi:hypothetical protein